MTENEKIATRIISTYWGDEVEKAIAAALDAKDKEAEAHRWEMPCEACGNHPSFWKTVTESPEWEAWCTYQRSLDITKEKPEIKNGIKRWNFFDIDESTECGHISPEHFQAFISFIKK